MKYIISLIVIFTLSSCVEKIDFNIQNRLPGLVIEGYVSNKSYADERAYPSDGRLFTIRLGEFSDVSNHEDVPILGATVVLKDDLGNSYAYQPVADKEGFYALNDLSFKTIYGRSYQLSVTLQNGYLFESNWETMPCPETEILDFSIDEVKKDKYVYKSGGVKEIKTFDGINVNIDIPLNSDSTHYYLWKYKPLWVYSAPDLQPGNPIKKCWVRSNYYLKEFTFLEDQSGGYKNHLFYIQTLKNNRVYEYFSALVIQRRISKGYYEFWNDLDAQIEKGGLFDKPPFNLPTNFTAVNNDWDVAGYFGVTTEMGKRWTLDYNDLSYSIPNDNAAVCALDFGPSAGPTQCDDCREYTDGAPGITPPWWW